MQDKLDQDKRVKAPEDQDHPKEEQDLDEALYDSFPASDPVSVVQKGEPTSPARGEEVDRKQKADKMKKD
jgi:hypothetical protein